VIKDRFMVSCFGWLVMVGSWFGAASHGGVAFVAGVQAGASSD
jgi:TRAP-type C4-dicarboxylate transport system permease small subunit